MARLRAEFKERRRCFVRLEESAGEDRAQEARGSWRSPLAFGSLRAPA
jgi:hypothetical protein